VVPHLLQVPAGADPEEKRSPESLSSGATSFALMIGSRSTRRQIAVPIRMRSVAAAMVVRATNAS
jgi:hypothetical protein